MQNVFFHITYLLTKHECVIIPDLGAFVVSSVCAQKTKESAVFCPPAQILGFNPEINHNDGILASSISKEKAISYKEANILVRQFTEGLLLQLHAGKTIQIPWVGSLCISSENKVLFTPDNHLICNTSNYGLSNFYLPLLKEIETSLEQPVLVEKENKDVIWVPFNRRIATMTGSVAAAVLALFLISTPVNNHTRQTELQSADFLSLSSALLGRDALETEKTLALDSIALADSISTSVSGIDSNKPTRYYYIVIASLPTKNSADKMLETIRSTSFKDAGIVNNGENFRIFVRQLEDKDEAERFLESFRSDYPQHQNAWLLSERIKS